MKCFVDTEAVNLATGDRYQRVVGDGESRLLKCRGAVDVARLGPSRDIVFGPHEAELTVDDIVRHANRILKGMPMHYKNGRKAKNGDKIVILPDPQYGGTPVVGILYDAKLGNDFCNGKVAVTKPNDPCPNLNECLHVEDVYAALGSLDRVRDQEKLRLDSQTP